MFIIFFGNQSANIVIFFQYNNNQDNFSPNYIIFHLIIVVNRKNILNFAR